ncbi:hypothetical protein FQA39_LY01386 [Lamprigera yunnana]|nr:hypothetical protein FQA39_LY01386 [Lamprigera yunnana]
MDKALVHIITGCVCIAFVQYFALGFGQFCEESGIEFKKGETVTIPGQCESFTCEEPKINLMLGKRCETNRKGCVEEPGDNSKDFPDCCPKFVCS